MLNRLLSSLILLLPLCGNAQLNFADLSEAVGLGETLGANISLSVSDFNMDGLDDFYVGVNGDPNLLFRNNDDGTFTEVAQELGIAGDELTYTAAWGDIDNDGDPDLYVGNRVSADQLYRNNGDGSFTNITFLAGIDNWSAPRSVLFADIDQDGLLDIYVANLSDENALYYNQGDNTFSNQTISRGLSDPRISMGSIFFDYDQDGDLDLYLTHDNNQPNILYQNDGTGYFTDVSVASGTNYAGFGMGVDVGDINNDGLLDMYITNLYDNVLLLNQGDGTFSDITSTAGINDLGMGWGVTFLDFDNDSYLDIYIVNDSYFSPLPNRLFRNLGDNTFEIVSEGQVEQSLYGGYASASLDFNKDGKIDILVSNFGANGGIQYFQNTSTNSNNWLQLKLEGVQSNRDAVGARITVQAGELTLTDEVNAGSGYAAQNSLWQHFGLGDYTTVDLITIRWPSGQVDEIENVNSNQALTIIEGEGILVNTAAIIVPDFSYMLYPNPASKVLNITLDAPAKEQLTLEIRNTNGQLQSLINTTSVFKGQKNVQINIDQLVHGSYILSLIGKHSHSNVLFVK
jgi:hypothetical protein